jgi:F0F1-type ATP synthase delta subunit
MSLWYAFSFYSNSLTVSIMLAQYYARALYEIVQNESPSEQGKYVGNLMALLKRKGHFKLLPFILKEYTKLSAGKEKDSMIVLSRHSDNQALRQARDAYERHFHLEEPHVAVDESIVGGFRIKSGNKILDASYKTALLQLYRNMIA